MLLDEGDTEGACNRAYYAMLDAARAAFFEVGAEEQTASIKSHGGSISAFSKHLVLTGHIDASHGRAFGRVERVRQIADYTCDPPDLEAARACLDQAAAFVEAIRGRFSL